MENKYTDLCIEGPKGSLPIKDDDNLGKKIAMLVENMCLGLPAVTSAQKYGYSRPRFYQIKNNFINFGTDGLIEKKRGPTKKRVLTDTIVNQIIRHRFLDPDASIDVIAQKMAQTEHKISKRSVERTITEYGLQKKTLYLQSGKRKQKNRNS